MPQGGIANDVAQYRVRCNANDETHCDVDVVYLDDTLSNGSVLQHVGDLAVQ
jgi:hypothetical protein